MSNPLLTIGMPCYDNLTEVWFTIQALRMYQDMSDTEILVVDNKGDDAFQKAINTPGVRYERFTDVSGAGPAKNRVFDAARGEFVICMDSHVLLWPDAVRKLKDWLSGNWEDAKNLIHGPMVLKNLTNAYTHYKNQWRGQMWGIWPPAIAPADLPKEPIEIEMGPTGLFGCRKDSWLRFAPGLQGYGGIEGIINKKYEKAGRRSITLPFLMWVHFFGSKHAYPLKTTDKIRNFMTSFEEVGMDPSPVYEHFGAERVRKIEHGRYSRVA